PRVLAKPGNGAFARRYPANRLATCRSASIDDRPCRTSLRRAHRACLKNPIKESCMTRAVPEPRKTLDPDRVAEWLARHPDFFVGREGLLQQLKVPHPEARGTTSLLERLVHDLRQRAEQAESRLEHLLESARHDEVQYRRIRALVLALVEAEDADALSQALA